MRVREQGVVGTRAALPKAFQLRKSLCVLNTEPADEDKEAGGGAS